MMTAGRLVAMGRVADLLPVGREHLVSSSSLCAVLGCTRRELQKAIQRERADGETICATSGDPAGYWMAESQEDWNQYVITVADIAAEWTHRAERYATYTVGSVSGSAGDTTAASDGIGVYHDEEDTK